MERNNMVIWKCMSCQSETTYKGLCRECTKYDVGGKVVEAVRRIKVNSLGLPLIKRNVGNNTHINKGFRASKKIDVHKTLVEDINDLLTEEDGYIDLA